MVSIRRDVFQAIADPTRRDILALITHGSMNPNSIAEKFEMSRPAISQHIKVLTECGLVTIKKEGRMRYCELQADKLAEVDDWLTPFKALWARRLDKLDNYLNELQGKSNRK